MSPASRRRPLIKRLLKWLANPGLRKQIARSPDRLVLVGEMLPVFARRPGQILWVGVRAYTKGYPAVLEQRGAICWTTDIMPASARWGRAGRHWTGDLLEIGEVFAPGSFSTVLCNGVFGFGVDTVEMQAKAFEAMAKVLQPGGVLLLGWNTDRIPDPLAAQAWRPLFERSGLEGLPERRHIEGTTHVYDLLRRRAAF